MPPKGACPSGRESCVIPIFAELAASQGFRFSKKSRKDSHDPPIRGMRIDNWRPSVLRSPTRRPARLLAAFAVLAVLGALQCASASAATDTTQFSVTAGTLSFGTAPDVPNLPALTLNGQLQTLNAAMSNYSVSDATGSGAGWNVTVNGDGSGGKSAVFKQYCPNATCGTDTGPGYVSGGATLAANSLSLSSSGAGFTALYGTTGTAPTPQCSPGRNVHPPTAV